MVFFKEIFEEYEDFFFLVMKVIIRICLLFSRYLFGIIFFNVLILDFLFVEFWCGIVMVF